MAKKEWVMNLISAGLNRDDKVFRHLVQEFLEDEKAHDRVGTVNQLERMLKTPIQSFLVDDSYFDLFVHENQVKSYLYNKTPMRKLEDIMLTPKLRKTVDEILDEQKAWEELTAHGLTPCHKILFKGFPGTGKTSLAEAMAERLQIPFFVVRLEELINSLMGSTAKNLNTIFSYAVKQRCVLFFDEFDAISMARSTTNESAGNELSRVVNTLLLCLDALPPHVIFIGATNRSDMLDKAVCRRMEANLWLPLPDAEALEAFYLKYEKDNDFSPAMSVKNIAKVSSGLSYAQAEQLIKLMHKKSIIYGNEIDYEEIARTFVKGL